MDASAPAPDSLSGHAPVPLAPAVLDPGWLFILAGMALIGCSVLIPAADGLAEARHLRDRALAIEQHRLERLTRHEEFLEGLHARDQTLALSLAASQLNEIPIDRSPMPVSDGGPGSHQPGKPPVSSQAPGEESLGLTDASVFPALEPPPVQLPERRRGDSLLERMVLSPKTGIWIGLAGAVSVLIGLLPRARR